MLGQTIKSYSLFIQHIQSMIPMTFPNPIPKQIIQTHQPDKQHAAKGHRALPQKIHSTTFKFHELVAFEIHLLQTIVS